MQSATAATAGTPYVIYCHQNAATEQFPPVTGPAGYRCEWWRPGIFRIAPAGPRQFAAAAWWLMHYGHVFGSRDYCVFLAKSDDEVVHRSWVFPAFCRFPFMDSDDLQIGDTWTAVEHRGKGLATWAMRSIARREGSRGRRLWYVTADTNVASMRAVERAGFKRVGTGSRTQRLGLRLLGVFELASTEE